MAAATPRSFLRPLGIFGYDALEPALLAALATAEPLLLLGDHGAAKTLLLVQLAAALRLEFRHYNASLLQFDDLAGFPIPDERTGSVRYAAPPGAIWGAEAVFFDEIGRCRPETANKLFPIVHERRIQGILLTELRYRWAATNPPVEALDDDRAANDRYEGVELLDAALADRFSYVLPMPRFHELSDADKVAIVRGGGCAAPNAAATVRELVEATTDILGAAPDVLREAASQYALALVPRLSEAKIIVGGRRAATITRNVVAVWAACMALGRPDDVGAAFALGLFASIPDVARRPVSHAQLLAAHKSAWEQVRLPKEDPSRVLLAVRDPVRRSVLALTLPGLKPALRGEALCGALGRLSKVDAAIVAWQIFPRLVTPDRLVPATAVEIVAEIVNAVANGGERVFGWGAAAKWVADARSHIATCSLGTEDAEYLCNALCVHAVFPPQLSGGYSAAALRDVLIEPTLATWRRCAAALGNDADAMRKVA